MTGVLLASAASHGEQGLILAALAFVLVGAKLLGALVERTGQPAVLGELVFGILLGNLALFGGPSLAALQGSETFAILAELGRDPAAVRGRPRVDAARHARGRASPPRRWRSPGSWRRWRSASASGG